MVAGETTALLKEVTEYLHTQGALLKDDILSNLTADQLEENQTDLLIIGCSEDESVCQQYLLQLQEERSVNNLPIVAVVESSIEAAENILMAGVTDYISPKDSDEIWHQKIRSIFGESDNNAGANTIDITPSPSKKADGTLKVYIVEDDSLLRNLLATKFTDSGFTCEFSLNGSNFIEGVRAFKPDIIILDIMLPECSGLDLLEMVKKDPGLKDIPVIIFTNRDEADDKERAKSLGAAGFYVKAMTELSELVNEMERLAN